MLLYPFSRYSLNNVLGQSVNSFNIIHSFIHKRHSHWRHRSASFSASSFVYPRATSSKEWILVAGSSSCISTLVSVIFSQSVGISSFVSYVHVSLSSRPSVRLSPFKNLITDSAALLPVAIAWIAITDSPEASPAINTFSFDTDWSVCLSQSNVVFGLAFIAFFANAPLTLWPIANTIVSTSNSLVSSSSYDGANLPSASNIERHFLRVTPFMRPFSSL